MPLSPAVSWAFLVGFVAALSAVLLWRKLNGRRVPGYFALTEYWVYTPTDTLPKQEVLMDRMISANPHNRPGRPSIGAREGMLFTDIRLHIALAKRSKNPLIFRPDLFESDLKPSKEALARLSDAQSLIKVRYMSEAVLKDTRHLQFMPHLADAMTDLAGGLVVYDVVCEQIYTAEDFKSLLEKNNNAERPDMHVRVLWHIDQNDGLGCACTKGLRKVGLPELKTDPVDPDQEVLVTGLMHRVAHQLVRSQDLDNSFEIDEYGDTFIIELRERQGEHVMTSIKRRRGT
jgi:hypothetical protein